MYCTTVLFNSSSLCAFISFINFLNACFFFPVDLIMHPPHVSALFEGALYISHLKWIKENACFWLILIELSVQVSYMYTAIECVQITQTNWWKKYINSLSEHRWMFLKMLNSRGGANSLSSFFSIFMYIVPPIQTNHLLAYLLWKCLHIEIDIKIIIVILFYFITIEPTDHFGEHVFCKRTPGLQLLE